MRYEADVVAAVAALTPEIAEQALGLIEVEYEPLPPVADPRRAAAPDAELVHKGWSATRRDESLNRDGNCAMLSTIDKGDVDEAMAQADVVVKSRYVADASHAAPIEPRAIVAQWEGDKLTVWSSTQVPFDARAGIARDARSARDQRPRDRAATSAAASAAKCGFHQEAHVAALARGAGARSSSCSRASEEFIVPDHRREGMVIELETGVAERRDDRRPPGPAADRQRRLHRRRRVLPPDGGDPRRRPVPDPGTSRRGAKLVYTNHQPSGSVRAPTAPQACWAVEQHTDEVAAAVGMDGSSSAAATPSRAATTARAPDVRTDRPARDARARRRDGGYGQELPEDEAIGIAIGWWPSFASPAGAYVKLNADGSGTIVTGAQECGTGAVMGLRQLAADELGMEPEDFTLLYQDTDAGPVRHGRDRLADDVQQRPRGRRRGAPGRRAAAPARGRAARGARDDIQLPAAGRVAGSPDSARRDHRAGGECASGELLLGRGSGMPPDAAGVQPAAAASATSAWPRGSRRSSPARRRVSARPRHRRRARARGLGGARLGHDHQPGRRRGPGRRRRRDGHRPGALRGQQLQRRRPPAQHDDARLQAADPRRRAGAQARLGRDLRRGRRPARLEGRRRGAQVATPARSATRSRR